MQISGVEELERAAAKLAPHKERIATSAIAKNWMPALAKGIQDALTAPTPQRYRTLLTVIGGLDADVLALCILHSALHSLISIKNTYPDVALAIGDALAGECWAAGLTKKDPKLATRIRKRVQKTPTYSKRQQQSARAMAARAGYNTDDWSVELRLQAGTWAINQLLAHLPDVFATSANGQEKVLTITEGALAYAGGVMTDLVQRHPVWLPKTQEPPPWTDWNNGGTSDKRLSLALRLVRSRHKNTAAAVRKAISDGTMKPAVDALNALQSVPWKINSRVLDVIRECVATGINVPGNDAPLPETHSALRDTPPAELAALTRKADQVRKINRRLVGARTLLSMDMSTAELMAKHSRFWTPMNLDWRGRVYGVPSFNFQREDRVRALFLFADGEPIGEEGLYWLKVHAANCGDFDKISKRPFSARVQWVDNHLEQIERAAAKPLDEKWWMEADKPFQFLAACFELSEALAAGPKFVSQLPISFDGSCSGLQHLSAMTRDKKTADQVNLTPNETPQDIYQNVANIVAARVEKDAAEGDVIAATVSNAIKTIDRRKLVKRNVMTYSYSSTVLGMAEQLREDTMYDLSVSVLKREIPEHPFGDDDGYKASIYLAKCTYAAIKEAVPLPAQVMGFLQRLVRATANKNELLRWTTPVGLPWINLYYEPEYKRVNLWLQGASYKVKIAVGSKAQVARQKAANGVVPNFVHACDAAHLLRTVNAAVAEGIRSIASVHDSFGCLASRAARFRQLIREEFVRMYQEHDVLQEVFDQTREDGLKAAGSKQMPDKTPSKGTLDIEEVLNAEFAFA